MNIALTGATGFIGKGLKLSLESTGHSVFSVGRGIEATKLAESFKSQKIEAVIHLASLFIAEHKTEQISPLIQSNIEYGTQVLEATKVAGIHRFVNAGTAWQTYHSSHDQYRAVGLYAATKQAFEDILKFYADAYEMRAITLRIFDTYGPSDDRPKLVPKLFESIRSGSRIEISPGDQEIDLLFEDDLHSAFLAALDETAVSESGHTYYGLSSGHPISLKNLVAMIEFSSGKKLNVQWGARPYRTREVMKPTSNYPKLKSWKPQVSLESGIKRMLEAQT